MSQGTAPGQRHLSKTLPHCQTPSGACGILLCPLFKYHYCLNMCVCVCVCVLLHVSSFKVVIYLICLFSFLVLRNIVYFQFVANLFSVNFPLGMTE